MNNNIRSEIGPFAIVPLWLIKSGVSDGALVTYALMQAKWADSNGNCWPSQAAIAAERNLSKRGIYNHLVELVEFDAISVVHRYRDDDGKIHNSYILYLKPPTANRRTAVPSRLIEELAINEIMSEIGPFAIVPLWLIKSSVSDGAVMTFATMWAKWAYRDGKCSPSHAAIAAERNLSEQAIRNHLDELVELGAISVTHCP